MIDGFLFSRHLDDDEEVRLIIHRHWVFGVKTLFAPTLAFVTLWALLFFMPNRYMLLIVLSLEFATVMWWLHSFFDYYLDVWIITNEGIIDLSWHGWFHRESSRILYSDIHGVSYEILGFLGTVFRFGVLSAEKISSGSIISLPDVPQPRQVAVTILKCMEEYVHSKNLKDASTVQELLAQFVAGAMQQRELQGGVSEDKQARAITQKTTTFTSKKIVRKKAKK